jgi:Fe2+ or Zn2+ uptake regulation protein
VSVSLASVYDTLHQFTVVLRRVAFKHEQTEHDHFYVEDRLKLMESARPVLLSARLLCHRMASDRPR